MKFLKYFPKNSDGLYVLYELYSFDNFFRLFLKHGFKHKDSLNFIICNCSLSGFVFQDRIYNKEYLNLLSKDSMTPKNASVKSRLIFDIIQCLKN